MSPNSTADGTSTPANDGCMCSSSSCRFRKYQGALDGLGVLSALAWASSGAWRMIETRMMLSKISIAARNSIVTRCGQTYTRRSVFSTGAASRLATADTCSRRPAAARTADGGERCWAASRAPADEQEAHLLADERRGTGHIRADGHGPDAQLIPRQQVAGEAQEEGAEQQNRADGPVELTRRAVRARIEHAQHVQKHHDDHAVGRIP